MSTERQGLSIGIERNGGQFFLALKATGKLRHEGCETITPMIDSALSAVKDPRVKALIDAPELEDWEPRAAGDDFKIGLKQGNDFDRIAIPASRKWQKIRARIGSCFISGEVKYFDDREDTLEWLGARAKDPNLIAIVF